MLLSGAVFHMPEDVSCFTGSKCLCNGEARQYRIESRYRYRSVRCGDDGLRRDGTFKGERTLGSYGNRIGAVIHESEKTWLGGNITDTEYTEA